MLPFDVKQAFVFLIPKSAVHVTNPTRDHFFIKKWFCDTLSLRIFDFIVFQQKFRLQGSLYWRVGGQSFSGQRSRVRAQCLEKNSDCDWHASHSHLSKPFALLWPAQQGMRFPVIRGGCTNVRLESAAIPKYLWFHWKYNRNCKNQMPSCSALEPPSCARLSGGLLAATPDGQEAWNC